MPTTPRRITDANRRHTRLRKRYLARQEARRARLYTGVPTSAPTPEAFAPPPGTAEHANWQVLTDHWNWLRAHYTRQRQALLYRRALARQTWGLS